MIALSGRPPWCGDPFGYTFVPVPHARRTRMLARVAIERDGMLLCARHEDEGFGFFCLPGGKVDDCETVAQAAVREAFEEASVAIELDGVVFLQDDGEHFLDVIVRARIVAGEPLYVPTGQDKRLRDVLWLPARDLPTDFRPRAFAELLRSRPLDELPAVPLATYERVAAAL